MDHAVALVQTYLRVNGYFTVSEYPVMEAWHGYRAATDIDVMGFRFPGVRRTLAGPAAPQKARHWRIDPALQVPPDRPDMVVGEVKEGEAVFNASGQRPEVLAAALARFGCCAPDDSGALVERLLSDGRVRGPHGHEVRLVAFGSVLEGPEPPYLRIPLHGVVDFLERWIAENWDVLHHAQLKDPVLGFFAVMEKARRGARRA